MDWTIHARSPLREIRWIADAERLPRADRTFGTRLGVGARGPITVADAEGLLRDHAQEPHSTNPLGGRPDVRARRSLRALRHLVLDILALLQVTIATTRDRAEMHEHVGPTVVL